MALSWRYRGKSWKLSAMMIGVLVEIRIVYFPDTILKYYIFNDMLEETYFEFDINNLSEAA
jgi:hypothetical protein